MPDDQDPAATVPTGATDPPSGGTTQPTTLTLTQEQLDQQIGARVAQAQRAAAKALFDEYGFSSKAEADKFIKGAKEASKAQMTEAERLIAEANEAKAAADKAIADIAAERHAIAVKAALLDAGVPTNKVERLSKLVEVERGADATDIASAVEAVKEEFPEMFGAKSNARPPSSEPANGGPAPKRTTGSTRLDAGAAAARERIAARQKYRGGSTP